MNYRSKRKRHAGCPGLFHRIEAVDGGLCRVRLPGGRLCNTQAMAVAKASRECASGVIEITNRCNLQLRGIRAEAADRVVDLLIDAGLGPTAGGAATAQSRDERRNVMISPTAGVDPEAARDTSPIADHLVHAMQATPRFDRLSPKFAVLVDGGEAVAQVTHHHDIWLSAGGDRFVIGIAGAPARPAGRVLGIVDAEAAADSVIALIHAFVDLAGDDDERMREVLKRMDVHTVRDRALAHGAAIELPAQDGLPWRRPPAFLDRRLGVHLQNDGAFYIGFQPVLGRLDPDQLEGLARLSSSVGSGPLRITPWQGCIIAGVAQANLTAARTILQDMGFLLDGASSLARIVACSGSAGCVRAQVDTRSDAMVVAQVKLPPGVVHISGCKRSCASPVATEFTLMATTRDRYDLYRRTSATDLGDRVGECLTIHDAADVLEAIGAEYHDA